MFLVSKGIVDAHGGLLSVYSAGEGYGCTFSLQVPTITIEPVTENSTRTSDERQSSWIPRRKWSQIFASTDSDKLNSIKCSHYSPDATARKLSNVTARKLSSVRLNDAMPSIHGTGTRPLSDRMYEPSASLYKTSDRLNDRHRQRDEFMSSSESSVGDETITDIEDKELEKDEGDVRQSYGMSENMPSNINIHYKTLIVDDSTPSRNMLARLLRSKCGECDEAGDGLKAIEMVKVSMESGKPYDIILMDSEMPNMNGPETARHIKTQLGYTGLVIGVTGNALPEDISIFKSHGADDVLVKPIKISQFDEILNRLFRNYLMQAVSDSFEI